MKKCCRDKQQECVPGDVWLEHASKDPQIRSPNSGCPVKIRTACGAVQVATDPKLPSVTVETLAHSATVSSLLKSRRDVHEELR